MRNPKNPLRKLSKLQLLELLAEQEKELLKLREELAQKEKELNERALIMEESGSIAEAALKINGVFEAAQAAAEQYLCSLKKITYSKVDEEVLQSVMDEVKQHE